jgi:hypothetical protein
VSADVELARDAGRAIADDAGPVEDPAVVARLAILIHADVCKSPLATDGRPAAQAQAAAVLTDTKESNPDVQEEE